MANNSFALANNKGGSGKTFTLFQLASEVAAANPDRRVLVIDFSLYSETTSLFMGGLGRKDALSSEKGHLITLENTTSDTRAEGLVRALVADGEATARPSLLGRFFGGSTPAQREVNVLDYTVQPSKFNPRVPENLYLVASAKTDSWGQQHTGVGGAAMDVDEAPMWTRRGKEWEPAARRLRAALATLAGEWTVFVDTDHLAGSPLTKLALGAVSNTLVPLSLDEGDFSRMFHDATGNALFSDVMMPMAADGSLSAPVSKFIFTKITSQKNEPVTSPSGIKTPFSPAKIASAQMDTIAESVYSAAHKHPDLQPCLKGGAADGRLSEFAATHFTAFKTVADVAANTSKLHGAPIATMRSDDAELGKPDKKVLDAVRAELNELAKAVLGEGYRGR